MQGDGPIPIQVVPLVQGETASLFAHADPLDPIWQIGVCVPDYTRPGDRAVLYERHGGRGIVGVFDFASESFPYKDKVAAWGVARELDANLSRDRLLEGGDTAKFFRQLSGPAWLPEGVQERLAELLPLPPAGRSDYPLPPPGGSGLELLAEDAESVEANLWRSERHMQEAIAADREACHPLGLSPPARQEVRWAGGRFRFDLFGEQSIAECKLFATLESLAQLDGYLEQLRTADPDKQWRGHLVSAFGYSRDLAKQLEARDDVELWLCFRTTDDRPRLRQVHDQSSDPPRSAQQAALRGYTEIAWAMQRIIYFACSLALDAGLEEEEVSELSDPGTELEADERFQEGELPSLDADEYVPACLRRIVMAVDLIGRGMEAMLEPMGLSDRLLERAVEPWEDEDFLNADGDESPVEMVRGLFDSTGDARAAAMVLANTVGLDWSEVGRVWHGELDEEERRELHSPEALTPRAGFRYLWESLAETKDHAELIALYAGVSEDEVAALKEHAEGDEDESDDH